ncbi:deoxyribonuclease-1-like isoform X2 [Pseudochaenichthys georgianus]|uniref:deoxyribonuclease-1-like isoform X2 n=1 Tax=Pseudochaenichthys georgianus TaxID=52239 RepID=UPI00146BBF7F|nr:deoxyribonuclease-1-like isoform X2 [Pseudochaenichthys georgianus]
MRLLCALGLFSVLLHVTSCLLIGAFNIQQFGDKKSRNKDVMDIIKEIVLRYDIILIQEVLDPDWEVTNRLMDLVNNGSPQFANISSAPLGPGRHKERYLFLYRVQTVSVKGSFQYFPYRYSYRLAHSQRWSEIHVFERPPFVVKFSSTETDVEEFVLIPIHTSPRTAAEAARQYKQSTVGELQSLDNVVNEAKSLWHNNNIMVLGDFNAAGTYVRRDDFWNIPLFTNNNFHWLIDDDVNTVVSGSQKAYDRIVVTTDLNDGVVPCSADVFNFKNTYGLTQGQTLAVSDHFPVEVELRNTGTTTQTPTTQTPRRKQTYQERFLYILYGLNAVRGANRCQQWQRKRISVW